MTADLDLTTDYDADCDVLYVAVGQPVAASVQSDDDGLLWRYALSDGHACGVTVLGFESGWAHQVDRLVLLIGEHLDITPASVELSIMPLLH